ncbi:hypothetical protein ACQJ6D_05415, partial [Helicobacter pylori]
KKLKKSVKAYNAMMGHQPQNSLKHGLKNFNNPLVKRAKRFEWVKIPTFIGLWALENKRQIHSNFGSVPIKHG